MFTGGMLAAISRVSDANTHLVRVAGIAAGISAKKGRICEGWI
jgi:hypothetical protein